MLEPGAEAGPIGRADATTRNAAIRAWAVGAHAVDAAVDGGADLLLLGDVDAEDGPAVAALTAVLLDREPVACVRRGGDAGVWARTVEVVRTPAAAGSVTAPTRSGCSRRSGGPDLAALTGALVQAAVRRTPVLLDGTAATVCGLVAETFAPDCSLWWAAASRTGDPAQELALARLELDPVLDLGLGYDGAAAARAALPLLQAALATF